MVDLKSQPNINGDIINWFQIFRITFLLAHIDTCRRLAIACVYRQAFVCLYSSLQNHRFAITMLVSNYSSIASYAHTAHRTSLKLIFSVLVLLSFSPSTIVCVYLGPANLYSIILIIITVIIISFHFISFIHLNFILYSTCTSTFYTHIWARAHACAICSSYFSFPLLCNLSICFP